MKPIFTLHAGEFLFGDYVEKRFRDINLWTPTKDTGVDFLISDKSSRSTVSVQVKMSRDYRPPYASNKFERLLEAGGWFVFSRNALENSQADIWSIIVVSHQRKAQPAFVNISPNDLLNKLIAIHGEKTNYHLYPWFTAETCIEGRGTKNADKEMFARGVFEPGERDLSEYHDNWKFIQELSS